MSGRRMEGNMCGMRGGMEVSGEGSARRVFLTVVAVPRRRGRGLLGGER